VVRRLYGITFRLRDDVPLWHPDARYYDVLGPAGADSPATLIGGVYLDAYARPNKRSGAWMDDCVGRKQLATGNALPVAYLVCNALPGSEGRPAQLTHDDVVTLFHEFGHGLHHLLTRVKYPSIAGINGVAWDAVELPSQFFENYAWQPEVLREIAQHVETGESLPAEKIAQLLRTRSFQAGLATLRQVEFALLDFRLHAEYEPARGARIAEILGEVRKEVAVIRIPEWNRFPNSFGHIFAGGYAAGYYSYKWAEVLSADAFAAFEEAGIYDAATARRFVDNILSRGGSRDALDAFVAFRGRPPSIEPLLRQHGIAPAAKP
jgi:oligopeptidase A